MKKKRILLLAGLLALLALLFALLMTPRGESPTVSPENASHFRALLNDLAQAAEQPSEGDAARIEADLQAIRSLSRRDYRLARAIAAHWQSVFLDPEYRLYLYQGDPLAPELDGAGIPDSRDHAIVVLGYELRDGRMQPELTGRCQAAAALARAYPNTILICSGGATGPNNPEGNTEAGLIKDYLSRVCGIDPSRIFTDEKAMTTAENALNCFRIMQENDIRSMTIVTSAYHQRWGQAVYRAVGELYRRERGYEVRSIANYCFDTGPSVPAYRNGARIAAAQIAGILELPAERR